MITGTHMDELVDFNYKVRSIVIDDKDIMALMSDNPDIDMDGDDVELYAERVKDHDYVDDTSLTANSYIIIDSEITSRDTKTMKTLYLYVQIICSKGYMDMNPKKFKGIKGNRRDNIARLINAKLEGNLSFGVGELQLKSALISSLPTGYTGRTLTYVVHNFA